MSPSQLSERRQALVELSNAYREQIAEDFAALTPSLGAAERFSTSARQALRYAPLVVGLGVALIVWKRPGGILKAGKTALGLWSFCAPARPWLMAVLERWRESKQPQN